MTLLRLFAIMTTAIGALIFLGTLGFTLVQGPFIEIPSTSMKLIAWGVGTLTVGMIILVISSKNGYIPESDGENFPDV